MVDTILNASLVGYPLWLWVAFAITVLVVMVLDLGIINRKDKEINAKQALWLSAMYIGFGLAFAALLYATGREEASILYLHAFVLEKSLSVDNLFVFILIFSHFSVPAQYQHRVLFWGIVGAIVMRGIFIGLGAALVQQFEWILYFFGAFLVYSGIKLLFHTEEETPDMGNHPLVRTAMRTGRFTRDYHGSRFSIVQDGKRMFTPLCLVMLLLEVSDIIFAVDSIPAVLAISQDVFIIYTSNIFAILGLRALYFALKAVMHRFDYLKYGLSLVLSFIGLKMIAELALHIHVPSVISLGLTAGLLGGSILYSLYKSKNVI